MVIHFISACRLDERGRIVLPQELREQWKAIAGSLILIRANQGTATIAPTSDEEITLLSLRPASRNTLAL
ncbi:hypothetical protein HYS54_01025 [Candidatus Micrarchaeota archaeon]|nr:hypothetical protein [Candidatus Micrarchaeota archaeon]